jgi:hypothetical protein
MTPAIKWMVSSMVKFFGVQAWAPEVMRMVAVANTAGIFIILVIIMMLYK